MKEMPTPQQGSADATVRKSRRYSKEEPMLQQGSAGNVFENYWCPVKVISFPFHELIHLCF